jgi:dTDP-4-dehydrorhamnose reductase
MLRMKDWHQGNPEIWGGIECTINRIGDTWHDQLMANGHYSRNSDISLLASLGIKVIRYPILWERHQPNRQSVIDWTWIDRQLSDIRGHRITPIAGLLHHGSGPGFTDLSAPHFVEDFATYAGQVAARFPWVEHYTPVNEPLTTARFSGLYGLWFPHFTDPSCFVRMLLNQLEGTVKAMRAIRKINPAAMLIQTEDLAKVHSTSTLAYQADFENHRRWLTYDILCGRVDKTHPLWDYFMFLGIEEARLGFFLDNPCIPDVLGINYYITSERFLDEDLDKYAAGTHGGNGIHRYADTEAVRAIEPSGLRSLLSETWERYKVPMAITETHLHCTREEQMRWLKETWEIACSARRSGMDLRAVTPWALLGSFDWDSLLTRKDGHYEPGAFELREGELQITAVGKMIRSLACTGECDHPLLQQAGWWQRIQQQSSVADILLIVSDAGPLALGLAEACGIRGIAFARQPFSKADTEPAEEAQETLCVALGRLIKRPPWGIISVEARPEEKQILSVFSDVFNVPYMDTASCYDQNDFLNKFIDTAVAYSFEPRCEKAKVCL